MSSQDAASSSFPHSEPLGVGIAGCGAATALYYAPALRVLEQEGVLRVSALFDHDPDGATRTGRAFPGAARLGAFEELLQRGDIGLIVVASPARDHAEQAIRALRSGRPVLCENPLGTTVAEGQEIVKTASETRRLLAVGLLRRLFPAARTIRELLARGVLGHLRSFQCFEGGPVGWPVRPSSCFSTSIASGGVLLGSGTDVLDLLIWWLGRPAGIVYEDDAMGGVEANCRIRLWYDGFEGEVRLSRDWGRPNRYFFQGSRGWLGWTVNEADQIQIGFHDAEYVFEVRLHEAATENGSPAPGRLAPNFHQSFIEQIRSVAAAVRGEPSSIVSGTEALESLRLIEHCYRHRALLPMPWLSEREQLSARQLGGPVP